MRLERADTGLSRGAVSLVPLVDAMLILLVFFMVTSSFLDLDMLPVGGAEPAAAGAGAAAAVDRPAPVFVRLTAGGEVVLRGRRLPPSALAAALGDLWSGGPPAEVLILPSPEAPTASLVATMEAAVTAGAAAVRLLRLERGG